jgi:carbonic anhydrase/acetyltransferase-like protein (isoleucine patch superfamily)
VPERALILPWRGVRPRVAPTAFLAPTATVIGDVEIGADSSVWFGAVVRGDVHHVRIGARTNVQDRTVVHVTHTGIPALLGDEIMIGHACVIHACTLESRCFVGMGAILMDNAVVETGAMVAAGALVTPGRRVPAGELWAGTPARFVRKVRPEEHAEWQHLVEHYAALAAEYRSSLGG